MILGLDLTIELGNSLRPALQVQRVVNYPSLGFVALWKLSENMMSWDDAEAQFRDLYQSDPTFAYQLDSSGYSYLEAGHPFFYGAAIASQQLAEIAYRGLCHTGHGDIVVAISTFSYGC